MPHVALINLGSTQRADQRGAAINTLLAPQISPASENGSSPRIESNNPTFVPLAVLDNDHPCVEIHVLRTKCEHLSDAQTGAPRERDQRPIAHAGGSAVGAGADQALNLVRREQIRVKSPAT